MLSTTSQCLVLYGLLLAVNFHAFEQFVLNAPQAAFRPSLGGPKAISQSRVKLAPMPAAFKPSGSFSIGLNGDSAGKHSSIGKDFRLFALRKDVHLKEVDGVFEVSDEDELEYNRMQEKIEHEAEKRFLFLKNERTKMMKTSFDAYVSDAQLQQDPEYQRLRRQLKQIEDACIRTLLKKDGDNAGGMDGGKDAKWLHSLLKKSELDSKERDRLRELYAKRTTIWKRQQQKAKEILKLSFE